MGQRLPFFFQSLFQSFLFCVHINHFCPSSIFLLQFYLSIIVSVYFSFLLTVSSFLSSCLFQYFIVIENSLDAAFASDKYFQQKVLKIVSAKTLFVYRYIWCPLCHKIWRLIISPKRVSYFGKWNFFLKICFVWRSGH